MKIEYINKFVHEHFDLNSFVSNISWYSIFKRRECIMCEKEIPYIYMEGSQGYVSVPFHPFVKNIMENINKEFGYSLDVCFLNYYPDGDSSVGWHSDLSHPIDHSEPIVVVSFGDIREFCWKSKCVNENDIFKQKLGGDGSLLIMPAGMQDTHIHKIEKGAGQRVSLTFRKLKNQ